MLEHIPQVISKKVKQASCVKLNQKILIILFWILFNFEWQTKMPVFFRLVKLLKFLKLNFEQFAYLFLCLLILYSVIFENAYCLCTYSSSEERSC